MGYPNGWIEWAGDEDAFSAGAFRNWPCGCGGFVEWKRSQPTRFAYEVKAVSAVLRGELSYTGGCPMHEGLQRAAEAAEALHEAHHREESGG